MSHNLNIALHVKYIQSLDSVRSYLPSCPSAVPTEIPSTSAQKRDDLTYHLTEHLRLSGVYWGLVALCLMGRQDALNKEEMVRYVMSCWDDEKGETVFLYCEADTC